LVEAISKAIAAVKSAPYRYEIEVWPTTNVFKTGHRIRIDIACGDSPPLDFGGHYYGIKVERDTYYHDRDRASHVILPVIPPTDH
jgi:uncharacterized protein